MTRSISACRPMTGSSFDCRAASVRSKPSASMYGVFVCWCLLLVAAVLADDLQNLLPDLLQIHAEALEHACGDTLALANESKKQVLGSDVVVVETPGLVDRQLDDLLRAWRQADLTHDHGVAAADDELNGAANLRQLNAHIRQNARRDAVAFTNQAKE